MPISTTKRIEEQAPEGDGYTAARLLADAYDEVIMNLRIAIDAIDRKDIQTRCNAVTAAAESLNLLLPCIDVETEGEVREAIFQVHSFIISRLPRINFYNDISFAREAIKLVEVYRDTWAAIDDHMIEEEQTGVMSSAPELDSRDNNVAIAVGA